MRPHWSFNSSRKTAPCGLLWEQCHLPLGTTPRGGAHSFRRLLKGGASLRASRALAAAATAGGGPVSSLSSVSPLRKRYVQSTYQMRYQRHGSTRTAGGSRAPPPAAGESWTYILTSCPYTRARARSARGRTHAAPPSKRARERARAPTSPRPSSPRTAGSYNGGSMVTTASPSTPRPLDREGVGGRRSSE